MPHTSASADDEAAPSLITYTLSRPAEEANARYHHHNLMSSCGGYWRDSKTGPKHRRDERRLQARQLVADAHKVRCMVYGT